MLDLRVGRVVVTCNIALILRICVPCLLSIIRHIMNHIKSCPKIINEYFYTSYLCNRRGFIKVCSIIRVQVFFLHLRAEGATKGAIGFQEAALIPAEEENSDEEEQDWDWEQRPVDPFVWLVICGSEIKYSIKPFSSLVNFTFCLWVTNTCHSNRLQTTPLD